MTWLTDLKAKAERATNTEGKDCAAYDPICPHCVVIIPPDRLLALLAVVEAVKKIEGIELATEAPYIEMNRYEVQKQDLDAVFEALTHLDTLEGK